MTSVGEILGTLLDGDNEGANLPELLCFRCNESLGVSGVGLALMTEDGHQGVIGATDGAARQLEELQFTLGEGPCVDASDAGSPVLQADLAATGASRWHGFAPSALEAGIAAVFAFPLQVGGIRLGVMDLYRDTVGSLEEQELVDALSYADAAVVMLLHLQSQMEPGEGLHPQLADALGSRPEVHQATGIIAVQAAVGLVDALLLLRAHAFASGRSISDVARDVVRREIRFGADDETT